ncbi:putative cytochrome P450 [Tanacetum coccineum]
MVDENHIRTLGDYSKPSHKGYKNTIELPEGNNVVPLRSDTIIEEEKGIQDNAMYDNDIVRPNESNTMVPLKEVDKENEAKNGVGDKVVKSDEEKLKKIDEEKLGEAPNSQSVGYYLKHKINEKLVEGLTENQKFNDSLSATRVGKMKQKIYNLLSKGTLHDTILKKKVTKKQDIGENFEIPCNIGGLKHMNALANQGSDVNVMPLSIYKRLTDEMHAEMDIRLSLASHSYIYRLGIANDVLVDVAGYVYPVDFVILDKKEDGKRTFILGTPFLTTAKAMIQFDKGTITLRFGKSKMSSIGYLNPSVGSRRELRMI